MPSLNGTEFVNSPIDTILSPFIDMFGTGFYLIPILVLAGALYMKTRDPAMVSLWILGCGSILSTVSLFTGYIELNYIFIILTALGFVGLVLSTIMPRRD